MQLENVELRLEVCTLARGCLSVDCPPPATHAPAAQAFEYLQLPFAIVSATVGKLELQARRTAPLCDSCADTTTLF